MTLRTVTAGVAVLAVVAAFVSPVGGQPPTRAPRPRAPGPGAAGRPAPDRPQAPDARAMQQGLRLQKQFVDMMQDPNLAGQLAITRIKDIALKARRPEMAVRALHHIAESTDLPAVRRSALFTAGELQAQAGNTAEALESLAGICRQAPGPGGPARPAAHRPVADEVARRAREINRWLREHPEIARNIIRSFAQQRRDVPAPRPQARARPAAPTRIRRPDAMTPRGMPRPPAPRVRAPVMPGAARPDRAPGAMPRRPDADRGGPHPEQSRRPRQPEREDLSQRIRRQLEEMQQRERREPRPERREYRQPQGRLEPQAGRLREFMEQLQQRSRELDEQAERIERRLAELKQWAAELQQRDRQVQPRREGQRRREGQPDREDRDRDEGER